MSEPAYMVGYSRPPAHSRFKKGQSGNPGGKPGPKKLLKQQLDVALGEALDGNRQELRDAKPRQVIEALARKMVLDALDGRSSAQRLLLQLLDEEDTLRAEGQASAATPAGPGGDCETPDARFEEFRQRFETAVANGSGDDLLATVREFRSPTKFPSAGNLEENEIPQGAGETAEIREEADEENEEEDDEEKIAEGDRFVFEDENARRALGDRYDEFKRRFERAIHEGTVDDLVDLAMAFDVPRFAPVENTLKNSLSQGISEGISQKRPLSPGGRTKP